MPLRGDTAQGLYHIIICHYNSSLNFVCRQFGKKLFVLYYNTVRYGIKYCMKLLEQILSELGADTLKSFSVVPDFGGYFRSVKGVSEYSPEKIVLSLRKNFITVEGENLSLGKYFEEDLLIRGKIRCIKID